MQQPQDHDPVTRAVRFLANREPYAPKRHQLQQWRYNGTPSQITGIRQLLPANASLYYAHPHPNHSLHPIDDLQRHYQYLDDWYFFTGILQVGGVPTYSFTIIFNADSLGNVDTATESAVMCVSVLSSNPPQIFGSPIVSVSANAVETRRNPFLFSFPGSASSSFSIVSLSTDPAEPLFPLTVTGVDSANGIAVNLTFVSPWGSSKPLFQGSNKGYVGGAGMGWMYYSYVQLGTTGTITMGNGAPQTVTGKSWMDRQMGTTGQFPNLGLRVLDGLGQLMGPRSKSIAGWLWMCVMLDSGISLALATAAYRKKDGTYVAPTSTTATYANLQFADGSSRPVQGTVNLTLTWQKNAIGTYLVGARIQASADPTALDLQSTAFNPQMPSVFVGNGRLPVSETPSHVIGTMNGGTTAVTGFGFLETVGSMNSIQDATKILLGLAGYPASVTPTQPFLEADWKMAQRRGWTTIMILVGLIVLILVLRRRRQTLKARAYDI